jgi:hypothetical protein
MRGGTMRGCRFAERFREVIKFTHRKAARFAGLHAAVILFGAANESGDCRELS